MNKLKLHSPDLTQANIDKLAQLFPNCVAEARGADGVVKRSIDFDQLRQELSGSIVEGPQERYQLNWPGKREALLTANAPIAKTLRPCREESVDFDTTQNLFIEGDNLDALKLLQETYLNKVKLIYIDPPYNTGNDFIYEDDFAEDSASYFERSNQKDDHGNRMIANTESNGRIHSDWMSMIYPRLRLARNLLTVDGVIFISIDDHEVQNLRKICDEIFGEDNFKANVVWRRTVSGAVSGQGFSVSHDHVLCYSRTPSTELGRLPVDDQDDYKNPDKDVRGGYKTQKLERTLEGARPTMTFAIQTPVGPITKTWAVRPQKFEALLADNRIVFSKSGTPYYKQFLSEYKGKIPDTLWGKEAGNNQEGSKELSSLLGEKNLFTNPKPTKLLLQALRVGADDPAAIVLDFFAGSATTADAVLARNAEDGGKRRFILVQLPEICDKDSAASKAGYKTIAEISKERIRRAGKKIKSQYENGKISTIDHRPSTIDHRPSTIDHRPSTIDHRPSTIDHRRWLPRVENR
jgi:adenine-specific DNA-methyltransferase